MHTKLVLIWDRKFRVGGSPDRFDTVDYSRIVPNKTNGRWNASVRVTREHARLQILMSREMHVNLQ